ncbi:MAG: hypothetical protein JNM56_06210, partial [Planctomycetia bacterium]|nr:hypothetical protein [Planctomycetia bacterium]
MLNHWWRQLVRRFGYRLKAPHRSQSLARPRGYRPRLETLEDRTLMTAGILDSAFGSGGIVTTNVGLGDDFAGAVAAQTNGRILVAGYGINGNGDQDVIL